MREWMKIITEAEEPKELGEDGLFDQPSDDGPERESIEAKHREFLARHFFYAEPDVGNTKSFDQTGDYKCGACAFVNQAKDDCALVKLKSLDPNAGSCKHWEGSKADDNDLPPTRFIDGEDAAYGVAKNGEGFGCFRCPFASKANKPDSKGRTLYCGKADCRVLKNACCALNGAEVISNP
jgi:hypothetical protein